jgi:3-oxoacyl-[acyl-carrier-protein] synthase-1/3-oxoacyl-[acyl-carrier-protein] synthase II
MSAAILAYGAVSALGEGAAAFSAGHPGTLPRVAIAHDEELAAAGLARPFAARARVPGGDRATALVVRAMAGCTAQLDDARPGWQKERVGLVLGTSSGGMRAAERLFAALARGERGAGLPGSGALEGRSGDAEAAMYFGPMARAVREAGRAFEPAMLVLGACASSAIAVGLAWRWLERDACDIVLAGGLDEVTVFVAAGFEVLRATTAAPPPRPFRLGRDGMALGEGAAVVAMARATGSAAFAFVTGFGASSDAVHLTAPDRDGRGLARAAEGALEQAGRPRVDIVSAHATATPFNDPAEARAIRRALGERADDTVVHPFKAQIGHTLGAAGALELLATADAIRRGVLPGAAGEGDVDPDAAVRLLNRATAGAPRVGLKLSAAFGGADAALVVADSPAGRTRRLRASHVGAVVHADRAPDLATLAETTGLATERLARADGLVHWALAACARLQAAVGSLRGAGVVVGTALATLETNALFAARLRERGARWAEPRRFPYTSPNAAAGECSMAFGLTGPSFSVGGGVHAALEAVAAAALLVEGGDADRVVVVAVDDDGPVTRALTGGAVRGGAVALLVTSVAEGALARVGSLQLRRGGAAASPWAPGHAALLPLVAAAGACELASASPPDAMARVELL